MRAALIESWPALSYLFGIRPWEMGQLSPQELVVYVEAAADMQDQMRGR